MLFVEHDFLDRFDAAARTGFKGVEYVGPYDHEPEVVAAQLKKNGLAQVLFNLPPGDWAAGERGIAVLPDRIDEFRHARSVERDDASLTMSEKSRDAGKRLLTQKVNIWLVFKRRVSR
jgi:hydroxypyruvate isomerase